MARARKYLLAAPLALLALALLGLLVLDSAIGHRLIAETLAGEESESGVRLTIGRIDGSLFSELVFSDLALRDPAGTFFKLPSAEIGWRPLALLRHHIHLTRVVARRGVLLRLPQLKDTGPLGNLWPSRDLSIDRIAVERLTVAAPVLGIERKVDLNGRLAIRHGRADLALKGALGGGDRLAARFAAEEAANRFDLALDYAAPKGGLLAALTGASVARELVVAGKGNWRDWQGTLQARQGAATVARLALHQARGRFDLAGQLWPGTITTGITARALGPVLAVQGQGGAAGGVVTGQLAAHGPALVARAEGGLDLTAGAARALKLTARPSDPTLLGPAGRLTGLDIVAQLDGPFKTMALGWQASARSFEQGPTRLEAITTSGTAQRSAAGWDLPIKLGVARLTTGQAWINPRLVAGRAAGTVHLAGGRLSASHLAVEWPGIAGDLALAGTLAGGDYRLGGPVRGTALPLPNAGPTDAHGAMALHFTTGGNWDLGLSLTGAITHVGNPTLATLGGDRINLSATLATATGLPLLVREGRAESEKLHLAVRGERLPDGRMALVGQGSQRQYGSFTGRARFAEDGLHADLALRDPVPAAGLRDVSLGIAPAADGLALTTSGQSLIGPFAGAARLALPAGAPARLDLTRLAFSEVGVSGQLALTSGGPAGALAVAGGGVSGHVLLEPGRMGEGVRADLAMRDARFGGDRPLVIGEAKLTARGLIAHDHSTLEASVNGAGIGQGTLFLGRFAGSLRLADGRGAFTASLAGRRGNRFDLQASGDIAPGQIAAHALGSFAGQPIAMPRRAVFTRALAGDEGWDMAPAELDFGGGRAIASGHFGQFAQELELALAGMPLAFGDVAFPDLGLSGTASGRFHYQHRREQLPRAEAQLQLKRLSRAGLVLSSRPIDLALVARLDDASFEARAVASEGGAVRGRMQARIAALPPAGPLAERLRTGQLSGKMRYDGPADVPWRLIGLDNFDLSGPLAISADLAGSLDNPVIAGTLGGDALRLQSPLLGTDITQISARGSFTGSQLTLAALSGRTASSGEIAGSGRIDFAGISATRGPGLDFKLGAKKAQMLARVDLALTATGPIRIVSDGTSGTIAGRLAIDAARWRLGQASAVAELPFVPTREVNRPVDIAPATRRVMPWHFLVDAAGARNIRVIGMGIESQWGADIRLRGTIDAPTLIGSAALIEGSYEFAGKRFDLTRGRINFDGGSPPDPRLDIAANAEVSGVNATVTVRGTSLRPEIAFSSVPAMPEEELLARVLFGSSVTQISAPEALQLGAAVASLHGGGGLDPINKLRAVIGLDRLRIVSADAALGRQTGVAAGKYLGRRVFAEVVTDGRGYSATNLEFRVTSWLSLLGTVSTVGRQSVNARVSHDY